MNPSAAAATGVMIGTMCGFIGVVAIGVPIGAVIFRFACRFSDLDEPPFGKSMGIVLFSMLANNGINAVATFIFGIGGMPSVAQAVLAGVVSLAGAVVMSAALYAALLEINLKKGFLVTLYQFLIGLGVVVAIVIVFVIITVALGIGFAARK